MYLNRNFVSYTQLLCWHGTLPILKRDCACYSQFSVSYHAILHILAVMFQMWRLLNHYLYNHSTSMLSKQAHSKKQYSCSYMHSRDNVPMSYKTHFHSFIHNGPSKIVIVVNICCSISLFLRTDTDVMGKVVLII